MYSVYWCESWPKAAHRTDYICARSEGSLKISPGKRIAWKTIICIYLRTYSQIRCALWLCHNTYKPVAAPGGTGGTSPLPKKTPGNLQRIGNSSRLSQQWESIVGKIFKISLNFSKFLLKFSSKLLKFSIKLSKFVQTWTIFLKSQSLTLFAIQYT